MLANAGINPHYSLPFAKGETKKGPGFRVALPRTVIQGCPE
jgi:hypothetical protein